MVGRNVLPSGVTEGGANMKIQVTDLFENKHVDLSAKFTMEHSTSSYDQAVMVIEEWDQPMSHKNWVLGNGKVLQARQ